ncbi:MAG: DUF3137 domain-containing protein [Spirochaetes bacterium]|jgi:hypothetical protein|nr:DUF3137 domain-containing protein [Spirochaetota bacterium]
MKTLAELEAFHESDLRPDLQDLESLRLKKREKIRKLRFIMISLFFIPVGPASYFLAPFGEGDTDGEKIFFMILFQSIYILIIFCIFAVKRTNTRLSYEKAPEFKSLIIERIVKFIDPELTYEPKKRISIDDYLNSRIFYFDKNTELRGDDMVTGSIGKTDFAFSEINTYNIWTDSKGNTITCDIFHGLFFFANFNKNFKGTTFVFPRKRKKNFGRIRGILINFCFICPVLITRMKKNYGAPIKLEDPRFKKEFVVYGSDQIEARYILSTALMKRICDYREKTGKYIGISFVENRVHVAIAYPYGLFEVDIDESILDFRIVREFYEDMQHATGIVDDLNLNTRIWN